jgi:hypothetical protein
MPHQRGGKGHQMVGDLAPHHQIAGKDEERDG